MTPVRSLFKDRHERTGRVIDSAGAQLRLERGDWADYRGDRLAVVSSWTPTPVMSRSLSKYLKELDRLGYRILVVSTTAGSEELAWPHGIPEGTLVTRRENIGYDFGSWAAALHFVPQIRNARHALLTNDSMVGPFAPIDNLLEAAENSGADVFGLTESFQIIHHPQSFFLMFNHGVLAEKPWVEFFNEVRPQEEKVTIIQAYELGLSRYCARQGYSWETYVTAYETRSGRENPTLNGWRGILDAGVPFVKRNLLVGPATSDTSSQMRAEVQYRYGEDVQNWLPAGYVLPADAKRPERAL